MITILILLISAVTVVIGLLFVIVVIGIRQEPPMEELSEQASSLIAAFVRRLIGLYVRKPGSPMPRIGQGEERRCLARRPNVQAERK